MPLLALLLTPLLTTPTLSAPTQNLTTLRTQIAPIWVDDPPGRGTWALIYSCVFTILVCVYTAIHMNVPRIGESKLTFWVRKIKWVGIAIFAPEIVVFTAFLQWLTARMFLGKLVRIVAEGKEGDVMRFYGDDGSGSKFDMVYAYYAIMGGFAIDVENLDNKLKTVTLTPAGLLFLAKEGHLCQIKRNDIQDKSKADVLAKSLACLQILWVVVQVLERKIADYPITMLELHTVTHVICALIMYGMWIQKPLNIQEPTIVALRDDPEIVAVLLQRDFGWKSGSLEWLNIRNDVYADVDDLISSSKHGTTEIQLRSQISTRFCAFIKNEPATMSLRPMGWLSEYQSRPSSVEKPVCVLYSGQTLHSVIGPPLPGGESESPSPLHPFPMDNRYIGLFRSIERISLSEKDVRRLGLVVSWVSKQKNRAVPELSRLDSEENTSVNLSTLLQSLAKREYSVHPILEIDALISKRALNVSVNIDWNLHTADDATELASMAPLGLALAVLSGIYGGIHLTAINGVFPTSIEKLLWKIACFIILGYAGLSLLLALLMTLDTLINRLRTARRKRNWLNEHANLEGFKRPHSLFMVLIEFVSNVVEMGMNIEDYFPGRKEHSRREWLAFFGLVSVSPFWFIGMICFFISGWTYTASRLYLIVESFISLRHVPIGVYETPDLNIVGYIPHI